MLLLGTVILASTLLANELITVFILLPIQFIDICRNQLIAQHAVLFTVPIVLMTCQPLMIETLDAERAPFGYIIYEYESEQRLGYIGPDGRKSYFCVEELFGKGDCSKENIGKVIQSDSKLLSLTDSKWIEAESMIEGSFKVNQTGYYCIRVINPTGTNLKITTNFSNFYGKLPAEYKPLMSMSLTMALVFSLSAFAWGLLLLKHRSKIVDFQKYVIVMLGLSAGEMVSYFWFYSEYNRSGSSSTILLTLASLIGSIRMTAMLFILLIVSMGYGIVLPSLEDRAKPIYVLSAFYLTASLVYVLTSLTTRASGQILLLLSLLSITIGGGAFMTWTFDSLKVTSALLLERKQYAKLDLYQKLTSLLKLLYCSEILFLASSVIYVAGSGTSQAWYARNWKTLWFMTDGWQNLLNLVGMLGAAYIFRPKSNNITAAMNQLSSEPIDEDIESGPSQINMETFKIYETRLQKERERREFGGNPDWARPDNEE